MRNENELNEALDDAYGFQSEHGAEHGPNAFDEILACKTCQRVGREIRTLEARCAVIRNGNAAAANEAEAEAFALAREAAIATGDIEF